MRRVVKATTTTEMRGNYHKTFLSFATLLFQPLIQKRLRIHDTCGVHNLHGMPAILAGIFGALVAARANEAYYDYSLYEVCTHTHTLLYFAPLSLIYTRATIYTVY